MVHPINSIMDLSSMETTGSNQPIIIALTNLTRPIIMALTIKTKAQEKFKEPIRALDMGRDYQTLQKGSQI
jgi:hypothetical protein